MSIMEQGINSAAADVLAADLTFARMRGGKVVSHVADWEGDEPLYVGQHVRVADGNGAPWPATVTRIEDDGTVRLQVDENALAPTA